MNLAEHTPEAPKPKNQAPSGQPFIRPKLNINKPGDTYEQEADTMADKVMRMQMRGSRDSFDKSGNDRYYDPFRPEARDPFIKPANGGNDPFLKPSIKAVQRKHHGPDASEDEQLHRKEISILRKWNGLEDKDEMLHRKEGKEIEDDKMLHRKESMGAEPQTDSRLDSYINSLGTSGQPLPDTSRQFFEPRFGHDFSGVRIHNDSIAAKSAQSINALAYTTGNNIVFNEGQYAPGSDSGNRLLAHELTHVVQQGGEERVMKQDKKHKHSPAHKKETTKKHNSEVTTHAIYYYESDGTLLWKHQSDKSQVRLVNDNFASANKSKNIKDIPEKDLEQNSKDVGMTNEELNMRAFLTAIRQAENGGNSPLPYNSWNHFTHGKLNTFTDDPYEKNSHAYDSHPGTRYEHKKVKDKPDKIIDQGSAAGAYQILQGPFKGYQSLHPKEIPDFSPESQDRIAIYMIKYRHAEGDIANGNIESACKKLVKREGGEQFASLPGGSQQTVNLTTMKKLFKQNVSNELNGKSIIHTQKGKL